MRTILACSHAKLLFNADISAQTSAVNAEISYFMVNARKSAKSSYSVRIFVKLHVESVLLVI